MPVKMTPVSGSLGQPCCLAIPYLLCCRALQAASNPSLCAPTHTFSLFHGNPEVLGLVLGQAHHTTPRGMPQGRGVKPVCLQG